MRYEFDKTAWTSIEEGEKNCYLMAGAMNKYIIEERLYVETYENGIVLYIDEGINISIINKLKKICDIKIALVRNV